MDSVWMPPNRVSASAHDASMARRPFTIGPFGGIRRAVSVYSDASATESLALNAALNCIETCSMALTALDSENSIGCCLRGAFSSQLPISPQVLSRLTPNQFLGLLEKAPELVVRLRPDETGSLFENCSRFCRIVELLVAHGDEEELDLAVVGEV